MKQVEKLIGAAIKGLIALSVIVTIWGIWDVHVLPKLSEMGITQIKHSIDYHHRKVTKGGEDHYQVVLKNLTSKDVKIKAYTNLWVTWYNPFDLSKFDTQDRTVEATLPPGKEVVVADYTSAEGEWWGRTTQFYWGTEEFVSQ